MFVEVILAGGGMKGLALLGALSCLERHGCISTSSVRRYVGASVGAIISTLLIVGLSADDIFNVLCGIDFTKLSNVSCDSILNFPTTLGLSSSSHVIDMMQICLEHKGFSRDITFDALYAKTKRSLHVVAYCISKNKPVAFSFRTHPQMPVLMALRASIGIPFVFPPTIYDNDMYIDGCTVESCPVRFAKYNRRSIVLMFENAPVETSVSELSNLSTYMGVFMSCLKHHMNKGGFMCRTRPPKNVIEIHTNCSLLDFNMTLPSKIEIYRHGYRACEDFLRTPS